MLNAIVSKNSTTRFSQTYGIQNKEERGIRMVDFVVVDDEKEVLEKVEEIITEVMMKNNVGYHIHLFKDFDEQFYNLSHDDTKKKIYILDIQVRELSGIDVARSIRDYDTESVIIFLTAFGDLNGRVAEDIIMPLTYINKFNNSHQRLITAIDKALDVIGKRKMIRFAEKGSTFTIPVKDIFYIVRDTVERKSMIVTGYNEFKTSKSLVELLEMLGEPFVESHRACIINMDKVRIVDKRNRLITFDNGMKIDLVSPNFKIGVKEDVSNI